MERAIDSTSSKTSAGAPAAWAFGEGLVGAAGEQVHELAFLLYEGVRVRAHAASPKEVGADEQGTVASRKPLVS